MKMLKARWLLLAAIFAVAAPAAAEPAAPKERWAPAEVVARFEPAVLAALPAGVELDKLTATRSVSVARDSEIGRARVPKLPKREGAVKITISVEILTPGSSPMVVPVTANLRVGAEAASYAVPRGAELTAYIERGPTRIGAIAVAMADADIDDVVLLQIVKTRKVLKARIESKSSARVVSE